MITYERFMNQLRQPCGRTTGHGDSCARGWLCGACEEKARAADVIEALSAECTELRAKLGDYEKLIAKSNDKAQNTMKQ